MADPLSNNATLAEQRASINAAITELNQLNDDVSTTLVDPNELFMTISMGGME